MNDWIGLFVILLFVAGAFFGVRAVANPKPRTSEEFERNAAESSTLLGTSMNALHGFLNPEAARAKEAVMQLKGGRFRKKKREGKAGGNVSEAKDGEEEK